jgi:hypothetical protein
MEVLVLSIKDWISQDDKGTASESDYTLELHWRVTDKIMNEV